MPAAASCRCLRASPDEKPPQHRAVSLSRRRERGLGLGDAQDRSRTFLPERFCPKPLSFLGPQKSARLDRPKLRRLRQCANALRVERRLEPAEVSLIPALLSRLQRGSRARQRGEATAGAVVFVLSRHFAPHPTARAPTVGLLTQSGAIPASARPDRVRCRRLAFSRSKGRAVARGAAARLRCGALALLDPGETIHPAQIRIRELHREIDPEIDHV